MGGGFQVLPKKKKPKKPKKSDDAKKKERNRRGSRGKGGKGGAAAPKPIRTTQPAFASYAAKRKIHDKAIQLIRGGKMTKLKKSKEEMTAKQKAKRKKRADYFDSSDDSEGSDPPSDGSNPRYRPCFTNKRILDSQSGQTKKKQKKNDGKAKDIANILATPGPIVDMSFPELKIIEPILRALSGIGYVNPTPIQMQAIPLLLEHHDLLGVAQTGTGKTCAFGVPILQHILAARAANQTSSSSSSSSSSTVIAAEQTFTKNVVRALIVTPTRELAMQIEENMRSYAVHCGVSTVVLFGGVKQAKQEAQLNKGCEVVVATPGRLLDLIGQDLLSLSHVKHFVLDEADQMLDMGFIKDVSRIVALLPTARQSLFFSATMPEPVVKLARKILINNPRKVVIRPQQQTAERVEQQVYHVEGKLKVKLLVHIIKTIPKSANMLVFVRTKRGADIVAKLLNKAKVLADAIHGDKSQTQRQAALAQFKKGTCKILVATDVASRGLDIPMLDFVVNFDLPAVAETYVHRIGRTGRAGESGLAMSFVSIEERPLLKQVEKFINQSIPVVNGHPCEQNVSVQSARTLTQKKPVKYVTKVFGK